MKKIVSVFLVFVLLISSLSLQSFALCGSLYVNGERFYGTLEDAIVAAGMGGTVTVSGTVFTDPLGKLGDLLIHDVTIEGKNNAKIILSVDFIPHNDDNLDVITIKGNNVVIKNVLIDAGWRVDYPLNTYGDTDNLVIENVTVQHGIRGGINLMTGGHVLFKNVTLRNSYQAGFGVANCYDASNVKFENCVTSGNWYRSGILLCGGYGPTLNMDASGITCKEGHFSVHDRYSGSIGGGERQTITYKAPPKDASGNPIDTSTAMYYPLEKAYLCIRFGASKVEIMSAVCYVDTTAYGFETRVYFNDYEAAQNFLHDGEQIVDTNNGASDFFIWLLHIFNSIRINIF